MGDKPLSELTIIELLNLLDSVSAELRQRQVAYVRSFGIDSESTASFEKVDPVEPPSSSSRPLLRPWTCGYECLWCSNPCTRNKDIPTIAATSTDIGNEKA